MKDFGKFPLNNSRGSSFLRAFSIVSSMGVLAMLLTQSANRVAQLQAPQSTDSNTHTLSAPTSNLSCPISYSRSAACPEYRRDRTKSDRCQRYDECRVETIRLMDGSSCSRTVTTYHPTPSDCNKK